MINETAREAPLEPADETLRVRRHLWGRQIGSEASSLRVLDLEGGEMLIEPFERLALVVEESVQLGFTNLFENC